MVDDVAAGVRAVLASLPMTGVHQTVVRGGKTKRRLDWATLHQRTFGTDVLRCPCGGRRTIRALHSTRSAAEQRLTSLGMPLPSRILPRATAPPQLTVNVQGRRRRSARCI